MILDLVTALLIVQGTPPLIAGQDIARPLGEIDTDITMRNRLPVIRAGRDVTDRMAKIRARRGGGTATASEAMRVLSPADCDRLWFGRQNDRRRVLDAGRDPCAG